MEEIIKFLGGTALLLGAVAWLIRELMKHLLNKDIELHKNELKHQSEKTSISYKEKIELYKEVITPIIDLILLDKENIDSDTMVELEKKRLLITAHLVMFSTDNVFHLYNELIDYLYDSYEGEKIYEYEKVRSISIKLLSEIRKDIGIYSDEFIYKGTR